MNAPARQAAPRWADIATCPFLQTVHDGPDGTYPHGAACGLRRGPARAPSADELAWFCTNGCHHGCATYRRWREMEVVS